MRFKAIKRSTGNLQRQEGTAIVEFALVVMLLFVLVAGIWNFGRLWDARLVTVNAAREAARYGAIYGGDNALSEADVVALVKQRALEYLNREFDARGDVLPYSESDVIVLFPNGRYIGEPIQVKIAVKVEVGTPVRQFFGGAFSATVSGEASMRI